MSCFSLASSLHGDDWVTTAAVALHCHILMLISVCVSLLLITVCEMLIVVVSCCDVLLLFIASYVVV
jgi:hypothetical protein